MPWNDEISGNALQIAAYNGPRLRVTAGPGTGKTFSLMRRVARLLEEGVDPTRILLVTFTRVAAKDLEKEIDRLIVPGAERVVKGTLHSFCFSILNKAEVLELTQRVPRPLLNFEERFLLEDLGLFGFGNIYERKKILKAFEAAWAREQTQIPGSVNNNDDRRFQVHLDEWLRFHQSMLIGELVPITLRYIRDNPGCRERFLFDHVFVDEYQDLNKAEQSLIDLLTERANLTVIGDEDQSIYESFRYAHPEGISQFDTTHQNTFDVPLDICRRCPSTVVNIANELIQNNARRTPKSLLPMEGNPVGQLDIVQWPSMEAEARGIASYIDTKILAGDFEPGKLLILCPRRQFGYIIRDELLARGIAAHSFFHEEALDGNPKEIGESSAQQAFTLLTLLFNPDDRVALRCWLGYGHSSLRAKEYQRLTDFCSQNNISPREALDMMISGNLSLPYTQGILERYKLLLQRLAELAQQTNHQIFNQLFPEDQNWANPFRQIIDETIDEWTIGKIHETLLTNITQPELPSDVEYVRIMSLHKSKGLTADHVIVTGFIEGLIPTQFDENLSFDEQMRHREEQRRLFYVAITRPKKTLVLSSVLTLPRNLAHRMRLPFTRGTGQDAFTITSTFQAELGANCPRPILGHNWRY